MTQPRARKAAPERKGPSQDLRAYTLRGDAIKALSDMTLPKGAEIAIIPKTAAVEAKLKQSRQVRRSVWTVARSDASAVAAKPSGRISPQAFEPDARARAMLRGVEYAQADLRDAGGAYDVDQVRQLLHGVSRQSIDKRVRDGSLLAVPGPSNRRRFPTVQFNDDGQIVEGLKPVQAALGYANPWSVLSFLVNPQDGLSGDTPIERLRKGDVAAVVEAARGIGVQGA
jgi:hypothetical protein